MNSSLFSRLCYFFLALYLCPIFFVASCVGENKGVPVDFSKLEKKSDNKGIFEIGYNEEFGVKTIPVKLNGVEMNMIFDTGCSDVLISVAEVQLLYKQGTMADQDFKGYTVSAIADGSAMVNRVVNLRMVQIGGEEGITLRNVQATISNNVDAPLLIGNEVFDEMASIEVDNVKKVIRFKKY